MKKETTKPNVYTKEEKCPVTFRNKVIGWNIFLVDYENDIAKKFRFQTFVEKTK